MIEAHWVEEIDGLIWKEKVRVRKCREEFWFSRIWLHRLVTGYVPLGAIAEFKILEFNLGLICFGDKGMQRRYKVGWLNQYWKLMLH